jgi:acid phosphatase (class A)
MGLGLVIGLAFSLPAAAAPEAARGYVDPAELTAQVERFGEAPAPGSPEDLADKAASERYRALENTDRWYLATTHAEMRPPLGLRHFDCALGYRVEPEKAPALIRLYTRLLHDADGLAEQIKARSPRPRPVGDDPQRPACQRVTEAGRTSSSYPSGSASLATAYGEALVLLVPEKAEAVREAARQVALSRLVCAMHYPSDVAVGIKVGKIAFDLASVTPDFAEDIVAARIELAEAQATGAISPTCASERAAFALPLP